MKVTKEIALEILWGDHEDWEEVKDTREIIDQSRWTTSSCAVFFHKTTDNHYLMHWDVGSTEQQDQGPFEYQDEIELSEVKPKEVMVVKWFPVKKED